MLLFVRFFDTSSVMFVGTFLPVGANINRFVDFV